MKKIKLSISRSHWFFLMCLHFEREILYFKHYYYNDYIDLKWNLLLAMNETVKYICSWKFNFLYLICDKPSIQVSLASFNILFTSEAHLLFDFQFTDMLVAKLNIFEINNWEELVIRTYSRSELENSLEGKIKYILDLDDAQNLMTKKRKRF